MSMHHEQFAASQPAMDAAMIQAAHATQKSLVAEIEALRSALQAIVDESPKDTAYSWCQIKLARCNEIARNALHSEQST